MAKSTKDQIKTPDVSEEAVASAVPDVSANQTESKDGEHVTIPRSLLEQMMQDISDLKTGRTTQRPKKVVEHFARVRMLDSDSEEPKPVVRIGKVWTEREIGGDVSKAKIFFVKNMPELVKDASTTPEVAERTVNLLMFLNETPSVQVKFVEQKAVDKSKVLGEIRRSNPDPKKFGDTGKAFTPGVVENKIEIYEWESVVEFTEGVYQGARIKVKNDETLNI